MNDADKLVLNWHEMGEMLIGWFLFYYNNINKNTTRPVKVFVETHNCKLCETPVFTLRPKKRAKFWVRW